MAIIRKTITLTHQQDGWIRAQIESGAYTNDSECIRDLIRKEQDRKERRESIRAALIEGEKSGEPRPLDTRAFKKRVLGARG